MKSTSTFGLFLIVAGIDGIAMLGCISVPAWAKPVTAAATPIASELGVEFVPHSTSTVILERGGRRYLVDLVSQSVTEVSEPAGARLDTPKQTQDPPSGQTDGASIFNAQCAVCHGTDGKGVAAMKTPDFTDPKLQASLSDAEVMQIIKHGKPGTAMPAWGSKLPERDLSAVAEYIRALGGKRLASSAATAQQEGGRKIYEPGDDVLMTLPTGRRLQRHGLYLNFAHRFPYDPAFTGTARGGALLGLDGFAIPSFGFRFGVTDKFSVGIFRAPSIIARPIQISAAYNFLDEHDGRPLNLAVRFSMEGQNNFLKNYTENFEADLSRTVFSRAQLYLVSTVSLNNRPLQQVGSFESSEILDLPGHNTFYLGVGGALDVRPTVALVAEVMPTLVNGRALGIHRPAYSFGVQKKIWRHAFTFGFTNSPGTTVSQRAGTRASFLGDPSADTPGGLFIGFDLTRQLF